MTADGHVPVVPAVRPLNPKVVALGGGHGLFASLSALRRVTRQLTAIVTVADDGGSSGVLAAERHHLRIQWPHGGDDLVRPVCRHSRPRSRCITWIPSPAFSRRPAISSAMTTLRCLPPVQPTASVTKCFPCCRYPSRMIRSVAA